MELLLSLDEKEGKGRELSRTTERVIHVEKVAFRMACTRDRLTARGAHSSLSSLQSPVIPVAGPNAEPGGKGAF